MKSIGILTYWGVPNYGAWMQAYALNKLVRDITDKTKYSVEHINYLTKFHFDCYYKTDLRLLNAFSYNWNRIPQTKKMNEQELEERHFDVIITGSDSIWEFSVPEMGNDAHLIGNSLNCDKLISYAASFGVTEYEHLDHWAKDGLKNYDAISVRDQHSKNIVDNILGNTLSELLIDPALLYDFSSDENVLTPTFENYIVVYGTTFDDGTIERTKELAKKENLKILSLGYINSWCDMSFRKIELRTFEWLGLFKNAKYVVTSTFHGLMIGLSFNKQIKFYQAPYVKNRSQTLLEMLSINDEIFNFDCLLDYKTINSHISLLRENAKNFLKRELTNV